MSWLSGLSALGNPASIRQPADLRLGVMPHGHQRARQLLLTHPEQDVGLVLVGVNAAAQRPPTRPVRFNPGVMSRGNVSRLEHPGALGQETELDLVVARDARVGRPPVLVLPTEVVDDEGAELPLHVQHVVGRSQDAADRPRVLHVVQGAAPPVVFGQIRLVDVVQLHRHADDVVTLPAQQQRGNGRVHAAAHGDDGAVGDGWAGSGAHTSIVAGCNPIVKRYPVRVLLRQKVPQH